MTLIDGDKIITAQLYDDEYEEFKEDKMSIIDYVNMYTTEGVTTADDVLEQIRDEVNKLKKVSDGNKVYVGINDVFDIIDKYKGDKE